MNSLNLSQKDGGKLIKQGDFGSRLEFELLDENEEAIGTLDGKKALIALGSNGNAFWYTVGQVTGSTVAFHINKVLPIGKWELEIMVDDWVFPSDRKTTIKVVKSLRHYEPSEVVGTDAVAEIGEKVQAIEEFLQNTNRQDSNLKDELEELKSWMKEEFQANQATPRNDVDGINVDLLNIYNIAKI